MHKIKAAIALRKKDFENLLDKVKHENSNRALALIALDAAHDVIKLQRILIDELEISKEIKDLD